MSFAPGIRTRIFSLAVLIAVSLCALGQAAAQPMGEVVVVPLGAPALDAPLVAASMFEAELVDTRVSLIPLHDARDRFTARSRPPQTASDSDLDVLARAAHDAIEHVAFGRTAAAQRSVREVISRAERTLESLNRETATARQILDACLSLVRSALQAGKRDLALEQATRCRRLVPDLMPSEDAHPANVVGVLAEADNLLRRMRIGHLVVRSAPDNGCAVYLNGRHLGTTPFQLDRAAAGDYRVQVECNHTLARVHLVQLGDQPTSLLVDTQFDRVVASDPRLLLRYAAARDARTQAVSHAVQLGREIGASDVILVNALDGRVELLRVHVEQQRLVGRAVVQWSERHGFSRPGLDEAINALSAGRIEGQPSIKQNTSDVPESTDAAPVEEPVAEQVVVPPAAPQPPVAATAPVAEPPVVEPPTATAPEPVAAKPLPADSSKRNRRIAGYTMLVAAAGLTATGLAYDARAMKLNHQLSGLDVEAGADDETKANTQRKLNELQPKFDDARSLRWIGVAGPVIATAAVFTLVEPRARVAWWSYALAGVGAGLAGGGAYAIARRNECSLADEFDGCRSVKDSAARGAILVSAALPLLSVPFAQYLRKRPERPVALLPSAGPARFQLSLHGRF